MSRRIIFGCKVADVLNTSRVIGSAAEDDNDARKAPLVRCPLGRTSAARLSASAKPCALPLKAPRQKYLKCEQFCADGRRRTGIQSIQPCGGTHQPSGRIPGPQPTQPPSPGSPRCMIFLRIRLFFLGRYHVESIVSSRTLPRPGARKT